MWHLVEDGQPIGPLSATQMVEAIAAGRVRADTLVWTAGMGDWATATETPQWAPRFSATPPPPPIPR